LKGQLFCLAVLKDAKKELELIFFIPEEGEEKLVGLKP